MKNFKDREFEEVEGGFQDENGFYITPNGSFWDPDGVYFNHEGFDKYGGHYNSDLLYIPGPGWNSDLQCYGNEIQSNFSYNNKSRRRKGENDDEDVVNEFINDELDIVKILQKEDEDFVKNTYVNFILNPPKNDKNVNSALYINKNAEKDDKVIQNINNHSDTAKKENSIQVENAFKRKEININTHPNQKK